MRIHVAVVIVVVCPACEQRDAQHGQEVSSWSFTPGHIEVPEVPIASGRVISLSEADQALEEVWRLGEQFNANGSRHVVSMPCWASTEYARHLAQVVVDYPDSTAALTVRLELAAILDRSSEPSSRARAREIRGNIALQYPTRWQGTLAAKSILVWRVHDQPRALSGYEEEVEEVIARLKRLERRLPAEFVKWRKHRYAKPRFDLCAGFYDSIMYWSLQHDDLTTAKRLGERLVREYPDYWYVPQVKLKLETIAEGRNPNKRPPLEY